MRCNGCNHFVVSFQVNNQKLLGLNHVEVVTILKELPQSVRIVCGRRTIPSAFEEEELLSESTVSARVLELMSLNDYNCCPSFNSQNGLSGSLQNLSPSGERLVKAKSDGSLASSTTESVSLAKAKSRSLEPLTGLAMWSSEPIDVELIKGDRGLGFSILDYQVSVVSIFCSSTLNVYGME